jgi:mRNA-degrading endonuclease toxin of MazEF toxin-antitoxin module
VNVGYEILGKDAAFVRPVLVIQKFSHHTFLGVPLTSNPKKGYFRYPYSLNGKDGSILLDQIRTYDSRRFVGKRMGRIHPREFDKLKQVMRTCFSL